MRNESVKQLLKIKDDGILHHRESQSLEFKESFSLSALSDYFRDFAAFANNQGGYLIFGIVDRPRRELKGLSKKSYDQFDKLDPELITGDLLDIFSCAIHWEHDVIEIEDMKFGYFYIYEALLKPIICKKDAGKNQDIKNGEIYYRYGGRTQKIQYGELEYIINKRIEQNNNQWIDLVNKIGKSKPENVAILDTEKGIIAKEKSQILVVDEELVKEFQWIKEGEFSETKGEKTLKLVGKVQPIDQIEVIKKVKANKLKDYPLGAHDLAAEIKKKNSKIKRSQVWTAIKNTNLKNNKQYSDYVFKKLSQEKDFEENGILAKCTSSIYKYEAVEYLLEYIQDELIVN